MMSEETNDFKPLADADDATSQQPVTPAALQPKPMHMVSPCLPQAQAR